jgi:hypothetical protein
MLGPGTHPMILLILPLNHGQTYHKSSALHLLLLMYPLSLHGSLHLLSPLLLTAFLPLLFPLPSASSRLNKTSSPSPLCSLSLSLHILLLLLLPMHLCFPLQFLPWLSALLPLLLLHPLPPSVAHLLTLVALPPYFMASFMVFWWLHSSLYLHHPHLPLQFLLTT